MVAKLTRLPAETQQALQQIRLPRQRHAEITMLAIVLRLPDAGGAGSTQLCGPAVRQDQIERRGRLLQEFMHDEPGAGGRPIRSSREHCAPEVHLPDRKAAGSRADTDGESGKRRSSTLSINSTAWRRADHPARGTGAVGREEFKPDREPGRRAKASTAYASGVHYLNAGAALLVAGGLLGEHRHGLAFALELNQGRMRVPHRCPGGCRRAVEWADAHSNDHGAGLGRVPAAGPVHGAWSDRKPGLLPSGLEYLRHLEIEWSRRIRQTRSIATRRYERFLVAAREPHNRGSDRAALDDLIQRASRRWTF